MSPFFEHAFLNFEGREKNEKCLALMDEDTQVFSLLVGMASGHSIALTLPQHVELVKLSHYLQMAAMHH